MDSSAAEQEREIRDLIRRAERTPVPTSQLRREALKRLIELSRAPQASVKIKKLAADNISKFFKVFPELEEDALNAIYDLCEDPNSEVRKDGYKAIVQMSKEQPKWVKRNADVLVQLLQSDDQDEVNRVKKSLATHLDMSAVVTFGVLCDQIVPQDTPMDEDDKAIRDRLRMLVINFICEDAKRDIVKRHASTAGSEAENVLVEGLFKAVSKLGPSDAEKIVKEILLSLPSFQGRFTSRGNELLLLLLDRAKSSLDAELASENHCVTLQLTRSFLDLVLYLSVERAISDPRHVLQFYVDSALAKRDTPERLSRDDRLFLMMFIADVWKACSDVPEFDLKKMRRLIATASLNLLPAFVEAAPLDQRSWTACEQLLSLCHQRIGETTWRAPTVFNRTLEDIHSLAGQQQGLKLDRVQTLAKSIMNSSPPSNEGRPSPFYSGRRRSPSPFYSGRRRSPSPGRPPSSASGKRKVEVRPLPEQHRREREGSLSIRGQSQRDRPPHLQRQEWRQQERPARVQPTNNGRDSSTSSRTLDEDTYPAKKPRTTAGECTPDKGPSTGPPLLQRLQSTERIGPPPARLPPKPPPQAQSVKPTQDLTKPEPIRPPLSDARSSVPSTLTLPAPAPAPTPAPTLTPGGNGLVIKGAARDQDRARPPPPPPASLLERMRGDDGGFPGDAYGKRRKKRGRP